MALPIATWELSVGVYMLVKGFRVPSAAAPAGPTAGPVQPIASHA